jgi:predicted nucleic acid-binding protein
VAPSPADWDRAGNIQGRIWDEHAGQRQRSLQNDILIACSARALGALVITENTKDFTLIGRYVPHQATDLEGLARRLAP